MLFRPALGNELRMKLPFALTLTVAMLASALSASAATLNVSGGQLLGASDVIVDGSLYDVAFFDGSCIELYNGCDSVSDFTFQSGSAASLASQALLDQVFLDVASGRFDSNIELTNGCTTATGGRNCSILTPTGPSVIIEILPGLFSPSIPGYRALNHTDPGLDDAVFAGPFLMSGAADSSETSDIAFAVWTPVPEPGTALLVGLGLAAMSIRNRR